MTATLLWDVQDALKTVFAAAVAVPVYDGSDSVGEDDKAYVVVADPAQDETPMLAEQTASPMGNTWREESGAVSCAIEVWSGDEDIRAVRETAKTLLASCLEAISADRTLGGVLSPDRRAEVSAIRPREGPSKRGVLVRVGFTISYSALLT